MTSWDLQELGELVRTKYGEAQLSLLQPHLNSVDRKIRIASYHSYAYSQVFIECFKPEHDERLQAVRLILSNGEEANKFREAELVAEANVIACAQNTHSVSDILSYVIVHARKIDVTSDDRMTLSEVGKTLPPGALKDKITRLIGTTTFRYLQDFVNTTKHVSLVFSQYKVDLESTSDKDHGLKLAAFSYKQRSYPAKWSVDFLKELRDISVAYVEIGRELNGDVRAAA